MSYGPNYILTVRQREPGHGTSYLLGVGHLDAKGEPQITEPLVLLSPGRPDTRLGRVFPWILHVIKEEGELVPVSMYWPPKHVARYGLSGGQTVRAKVGGWGAAMADAVALAEQLAGGAR